MGREEEGDDDALEWYEKALAKAQTHVPAMQAGGTIVSLYD